MSRANGKTVWKSVGADEQGDGERSFWHSDELGSRGVAQLVVLEVTEREENGIQQLGMLRPERTSLRVRFMLSVRVPVIPITA